MEILPIILPVLIVGAIVVFVIKRMEQKYKEGTLGKKKSKNTQALLDSLIPLGMLCGCAMGTVFGMFSPFSLAVTISLGAGIGFLGGYLAYEGYGKTNDVMHD
nr:hypothetical protein [Gracilibacillus alcaliphilus]